MNRRDAVKALDGLALAPALKAKPSEGLIVVTMDERHSDIWAVKKCREVGRARVAIGDAHFVNDVAYCFQCKPAHAAEIVKTLGFAPGEEGDFELFVEYRRRENGDFSYWRIGGPHKLLGD